MAVEVAAGDDLDPGHCPSAPAEDQAQGLSRRELRRHHRRGGDVGRSHSPGEELPFTGRARRTQGESVEPEGRGELVGEGGQQVGELQAVLGDRGQGCRRRARLLQPHQLLLAAPGAVVATDEPPCGRHTDDDEPECGQPGHQGQGGGARPQGQGPDLHGARLQLHGVRRPAGRLLLGEGHDRLLGPGERDPASWRPQLQQRLPHPQRPDPQSCRVRAAIRDCRRRGRRVVGRHHHESLARVLHHGVTRVPSTGGHVGRDAGCGGFGERDLPRSRAGSRGGLVEGLAHRVAHRGDGVGGRSTSLTLCLQVCLFTREQEYAGRGEQGDDHDGGRRRPAPPDWLLRAHGRVTADLSARRFPLARNGTPMLAACALSSSFW